VAALRLTAGVALIDRFVVPTVFFELLYGPVILVMSIVG
jgi:hypothetical protein